MDNNGNDLEAGIISNIPRSINKKMRKRKHLDALLKFRSTKSHSNDVLRSSEDELFLPHQKSSITRIRSSPYRHCWYYSKCILSFGLVCIIIITCIALIYANIQLKNEVENLSLRINEIEKKFSNVELNNISLIITQLKTRLDSFEHWNIPVKDDSAKLVNERITEWNNQLDSFRNQLQSMKIYLEQLTNLVHNSSDKTSVMLNEFQSNLDKLQNQIDECKCSKELIHLKPSVIESDKLQQSIVTKLNDVNPSISQSLVINENKQATKDPIDVEQIVH